MPKMPMMAAEITNKELALSEVSCGKLNVDVDRSRFLSIVFDLLPESICFSIRNLDNSIKLILDYKKLLEQHNNSNYTESL